MQSGKFNIDSQALIRNQPSSSHLSFSLSAFNLFVIPMAAFLASILPTSFLPTIILPVPLIRDNAIPRSPRVHNVCALSVLVNAHLLDPIIIGSLSAVVEAALDRVTLAFVAVVIHVVYLRSYCCGL